MAINPDVSADCHASGSVPIAAWVASEHGELALCAHHLHQHRTQLKDWIVAPYGTLQPGTGVGTEATKQHYAITEG